MKAVAGAQGHEHCSTRYIKHNNHTLPCTSQVQLPILQIRFYLLHNGKSHAIILMLTALSGLDTLTVV